MDEQQPIKQRALDQHLPQTSPLRRYLAQKKETAGTPISASSPRWVDYRRIRNPRTLLVLPPMCLFEGAVKRVVPPLGLCYIAAALEQDGFEVTVLDCIVEASDEASRESDGTWRFGMSESRFREFLRSSGFDVIGLSMIYSADLRYLYRFAQITKEELPECIVVAGGLHASIYTERFLMDGAKGAGRCVDFVIRGEGERRMSAFLRNLSEGKLDLAQEGLAGWWEGRLFINPHQTQIQDLDALPLPAYHKVPIEKYFRHNVPFSPYPRGTRVMQLYTSRGCPVGCTFCASTNFAKLYRSRSPEAVIAEIEHYKKTFGIDELQFADDNLTFDRRRAFELFRRMIPLSIPWCTPNGIMINTLDEELLGLMIDSGMYQITLSVDSGSAKTLKQCHRKPVDLNRLPRLMEYLNRRGVLMHGTLVVGMPGEDVKDIEEGFRFVEQLPFHSMNVFIAQAIPGSELFEQEISKGTISYDEALRIDTASAGLRLSTVAPASLEAMIEQFLDRYNRLIRERDPVAWDRKYQAHKNRFKAICVGTPSANTAKIIAAQEEGLRVRDNVAMT